MSALVEKIAMLDMGDYLILTTPLPGPCAVCKASRRSFISRGGRTRCVSCDAAHLRNTETNASVTFDMAFNGPVVIPCTCKVSRDPDELFKCTCPAGYPENQPLEAHQ